MDVATTIQTKRTFCRVCEPACGLIATVAGDRLVALEADKAHPISKGFVCNKGIYGLDIHNDPDRLNHPLKQVAPGKFEAIDWDTALTEIALRLKTIVAEHGQGALGSYTGNPTAFNSLFGPAFGGFLQQLGVSKNFSSGTQDCANKFAGSEAVFGTRTLHPLPDIDHSDFILIIGENPAVSHMSFMSIPHPMQHLKDAEARGAVIVYVNPRLIESANIAGSVLKIKPDTDVYLLAALIHEINRAYGFAAVASTQQGKHIKELISFVSAYPADRVSRITGIPEESIKQLADEFATAPSACVHMSTGVNMGRQGTLAYWLLHMLVFVTGNLGRRGGNFYSLGFYERSTAAGSAIPEGFIDTPYGEVRKPGGVGINLPGNLLASYLTDPDEPIRALFVNSGNPVLSIGGEQHMRDALDSLDLLVCVDIYRNATAEYADYILPAAGAFEREDVNITGMGMQFQPSVQYTEAVVPPAFERKPEWWIFEKLNQIMGFQSLLDGVLDEDGQPNVWGRVDAMLRSQGRNMNELKAEQIIALERSDPAEFASFVQHEDKLVDCFPAIFLEAIERMEKICNELEAAPANQLKLIGKRDAYMINSWYANVAKLKTGERDRNYLFMHPVDAELRQITDGDQVAISNENGRIVTGVKLTEDLIEGVVAMTHGWGHKKSPGMRVANDKPGVNCNALLPSGPGSYEPLSNQAHMTGIPVEVQKK